MRTSTVIVAAALGLALRASAAFAQAEPLLVDADWLSQHLTDRNLVVLQVGDKAAYDAGHIPGARLIAEDDVTLPHDHNNPKDLMLELPDAAKLRSALESFGLSDDSRIVVYFSANGAIPSATRIIFTLDYIGLGDRTSLLNGGMDAWKRAGKSVSTEASKTTRGKLTARTPKNLVAEAAFVKTVPGRANFKLVDARAPVFYKGIQPTMNDLAGHIPGAVNIPFTEITDNRRLIDRDHVATLFMAAGIKPGDTVVVYCHIGQQATEVIFGARLLGHQVMLYDGAFQDWAVNNRGPVEK